MGSRLDLQTLLETLADYVYFQPPESKKIEYPCIVYSQSSLDTVYADDMLYNIKRGYEVIVIDRDPDSNIPFMVANLPMCKFERHYTADNLNHDVFNLYY
jgi:hypothetical protein